MATWSLPRPTTRGHMHGLDNVMENELSVTGWKSNSLGYISNGDKVPDVNITL